MGQHKSKAANISHAYVSYDDLPVEKQQQVHDKYLFLFTHYCNSRTQPSLNLLITNDKYHMTGYVFGTEISDCCTTVLTPLHIITTLFDTFIYNAERYTIEQQTYPWWKRRQYQYKGKKYVNTGMLTFAEKNPKKNTPERT